MIFSHNAIKLLQPTGPTIGIHRCANFGIVDTAGFAKDSYYLYRSLWNEESTTLHLVPGSWNQENLLLNISKLFERQMELSEELAERVPAIAYESIKESKKRKKEGFLGIFKKKDKKIQSVTSAQLHSLNRDVIKKQTEHFSRLSITADSLAYRNHDINCQLKNIIEAMDERITTDLGERERQIIKTREESKIYIAGITLFLFLMLLVSYFVIMRDYTGKERIRKKLPTELYEVLCGSNIANKS